MNLKPRDFYELKKKLRAYTYFPLFFYCVMRERVWIFTLNENSKFAVIFFMQNDNVSSYFDFLTLKPAKTEKSEFFK